MEFAKIDFAKTAAQIDVPFIEMPTKKAARIDAHIALGAYQDKSSI
jgi:hypothetical protein